MSSPNSLKLCPVFRYAHPKSAAEPTRESTVKVFSSWKLTTTFFCWKIIPRVDMSWTHVCFFPQVLADKVHTEKDHTSLRRWKDEDLSINYDPEEVGGDMISDRYSNHEILPTYSCNLKGNLTMRQFHQSNSTTLTSRNSSLMVGACCLDKFTHMETTWRCLRSQKWSLRELKPFRGIGGFPSNFYFKTACKWCLKDRSVQDPSMFIKKQ